MSAKVRAERILSKVYRFNENHQGSEAVNFVYNEIDTLLSSRKFSECNRLLEMADINRMPIIFRVGLLRITFPARDKLSSWNNVLALVKESIIREKKDYKALLQGLV